MTEQAANSKAALPEGALIADLLRERYSVDSNHKLSVIKIPEMKGGLGGTASLYHNQ